MSSPTRGTVQGSPLDEATLARMDAWWRAANYLAGTTPTSVAARACRKVRDWQWEPRPSA